MKKTISFIGAGNMATAIIHGLIEDSFPAEQIIAADMDTERTKFLAQSYAIRTTNDNSVAVANADVLVLAVKPQVLPQIARGLAEAVRTTSPVVISIAAGVQTRHLEHWLGSGTAIIRTMPNTPAMLQTGTTGLFANAHASDEQRNLAESILRAVGVTVWIDEETMMDTVTAISGSGPAYFFLFMEHIMSAAEHMGLDARTAKLLTLHTAYGAARMALENPESPARLRERVTSPGGTTASALESFYHASLEQIIRDALRAARDRSIKLSDQMLDD